MLAEKSAKNKPRPRRTLEDASEELEAARRHERVARDRFEGERPLDPGVGRGPEVLAAVDDPALEAVPHLVVRQVVKQLEREDDRRAALVLEAGGQRPLVPRVGDDGRGDARVRVVHAPFELAQASWDASTPT